MYGYKNRLLSHRYLIELLGMALVVLGFVAVVWPADATDTPQHNSPASPSIPAEFATYRYDLIMSKDDKVCKHMDHVYNTKFSRPFDEFRFSPAEREHSMPPIFSKYPTSGEFEAVHWQYPKIFTMDGKTFFSLPVAKLDINNDGQKEIVIKSAFFSGSYGDELRVFSDDTLRLTKPITWRQLSTGQDNKGRPSIIHSGAILRPFVLNGITYLSSYSYYQPDYEQKAPIYSPPEIMTVQKYIKGSVSRDTPIQLEDICKFNMTRMAPSSGQRK